MSTVEQFGRFIDDGACFELTAEPPRKWRNIHFNKVGEHEVYSEISNLGDGPIRVRDAKGRACHLTSFDSRFYYVRDEESGTVFCPWGAPAPQEVEDRSCRFYAAKTEITGTCDGLKATLREFVPRDLVLTATTLFVENLTDRPRKVSLFAYATIQLNGCDEEGGGIGKENFAEVLPEIGGVFITNRNMFVPTDRFKAYHVTLQQEAYVGGSAYRDHFTRSEYALGTPKLLWGWNADNKPGFGPDCAGAVQVTLDIPPKTTARADFLIGQATCVDDVKKLRAELTPEALDAMCQEQMDIEADRAQAFQVDTGRPNCDAMVNHFVKKQMASYLINKSGFRDNLQIDNAICLFDYAMAEDNVLRALASQYANGCVPHGFRPLSRLQYADKPAWTMLTIPGLICESGDLSLLDKTVPYLESDETGTVWDHMLRATRFLCGDLGVNGLCDQHHADWNDGLEATQEAGPRESVFVTEQLCYGLLQMQMLAEAIGDESVAAEARRHHEEFARRINDVAWDGNWYVRTICGDGYRIGSRDNTDGKIFLTTQAWAVLSGIAPPDRARQCMAAVDEHIEEDVGFRICSPPFSTYDPRVGRMSNSMPGAAENGGCYCHAAGFKLLADCMLGRAEEAWRTFVKTAPDNPENPTTRSQAEPFSFTNMYSTVPQVYGRAGYPWRTGTAGWMTVGLIEWILGARRSLAGLLIDPCLPKSLARAGVVRTFRGVRYEIELDNSAGRCKGATRITADGEVIDGNVLPVFDGGTHKVEVVI